MRGLSDAGRGIGSRALFRMIVDDALSALSGEFEALYSHLGRPSIPPERLLRALLLQAFYSVRSERLLMEQLDYNLLFRWFVRIGIEIRCGIRPRSRPTATGCLRARSRPSSWRRVRQLLSREHFSVDGTLIQAWASMKSFRRKNGADEPPGDGRNGSRNFHGEQRRKHVSAPCCVARAFASAQPIKHSILQQPADHDRADGRDGGRARALHPARHVDRRAEGLSARRRPRTVA
jgi:transposase